MRRFISLVLSLCLVLCMVPAARASAAPRLAGSHETAKPGDEVTVTLDLTGNPGVSAWKITLGWDPAVLILNEQSITLHSAFLPGMFVKNTKNDGSVQLVWAHAQDVSADGALITLSFTVADSAPTGVHSVSVAVSGCKDKDGTGISVSTSAASVDVSRTDGSSPAPTPTPEPAPQPSPEPTPEPAVSFTDVVKGSYYYDAVIWAVGEGITTGTSAATFTPNRPCTRAEIVTFLWRAAGSPQPSSSAASFTDIDPAAFYYKAVLWAVERGITTGTTATTFEPYRTADRAQTVTFIWRSFGAPNCPGGTPFGDVQSGTYYAAAVSWAVSEGITTGTSSTAFSPHELCSRGQIVTFLYRAADL